MCKTKKQAFLTIRTTALYGWGKSEVSWGTGSTRWRWPMLYFMRVSSGVIIPLDSYMLQTNTREEVRGRVFSFHLATYGGFMQLSYLASGFAYDQWGIPLVGLVIGVVSLICGTGWLIQYMQGKLGPADRAYSGGAYHRDVSK